MDNSALKSEWNYETNDPVPSDRKSEATGLVKVIKITVYYF